LQLLVSIKDRNKNRDTTGDPWNGRTLEWSTKSPPPFYNFAHTPEVHQKDAFWIAKAKGEIEPPKKFHPIPMPKNTAMGFYISALSFTLAFALIWYIFWLAALCALGIIACAMIRLFVKEHEYLVSAEEVEKIEKGGLYGS
jgi:cytochrome o ubiquinol oxidase subunit 1